VNVTPIRSANGIGKELIFSSGVISLSPYLEQMIEIAAVKAMHEEFSGGGN
jgi:hypothetical protein